MTLAKAPILAILLAACTHTDAFTPHDTSTSDPLVAATPSRLTYNPLADITPAYAPDGASVFYAFGSEESRQGDQCLGELPPTGGTLRRTSCNRGPFAADSIETLAWPSVSAGGRLAYSRASRFRTALVNASALLVTAPASAPDSFTPVRSFPFQLPNGHFYDAPAYTRWLNENLLVFVGLTDTPVGCPPPCPGILVRNGRDILRADFQGGGVILTAVSGTEWATSVSPAGADEIYYTLAGSAKILRQGLAAGAVTTVHDFGTAGIARDVAVANGILAAIVGGLVQLRRDNTSTIQDDLAGHLMIVNLAAGTARELAAPLTLFRHPVLSPDGNDVIVEAYPLRLTDVRSAQGTLIRVDTTIAGAPDLWEFGTQ